MEYVVISALVLLVTIPPAVIQWRATRAMIDVSRRNRLTAIEQHRRVLAEHRSALESAGLEPPQ
jgi:hypothetical protein